MASEADKQVVRRYYDEVLNARNVDALAELAVSHYEEHDMLPGQGTGLAGLRERVMMLTGALDSRFTIEDVIAEGDKVVIRVTEHGSHEGELQGIPATGRQVTATGVGVARIQAGRIVEAWAAYDALGLMQQLGAIPAPTQTA